MTTSGPLPQPDQAVAIASDFFQEPVESCVRFPTGLRNWVFDVTMRNGRRAVVRLCRPENRRELAGGVHWAAQLGALGIPVARVLHHDTTAAQPFTILERLDGTDIGAVIGSFSDADARRAARTVADWQTRCCELPRANGFGYATSLDDPLQTAWHDVIGADVRRARRWIEAAGVVDPALGARVEKRVAERKGLTAAIAPSAFLHDATTKNVIVDDGRITGLVDVDEMAFGDPLWAVALTRMSLIASRHPTVYADEQHGLLGSDSRAYERLALYTAVHCLTFLGELGQAFNQDAPTPIDPEFQHHLEATLNELLDD